MANAMVKSEEFLPPSFCREKDGVDSSNDSAFREQQVCSITLDMQLQIQHTTASSARGVKGFSTRMHTPAVPYNYTGKFVDESIHKKYADDPVALGREIAKVEPYDVLYKGNGAKHRGIDPRKRTHTVVIRDFGCKVPLDAAQAQTVARAILGTYPDHYFTFLDELVSNLFGDKMVAYLDGLHRGYEHLLRAPEKLNRLSWQAYVGVQGGVDPTKKDKDGKWLAGQSGYDCTLTYREQMEKTLSCLSEVNARSMIGQCSAEDVFNLRPCIQQHIETLCKMKTLCRGYATDEADVVAMLWFANEEGNRYVHDLMLMTGEECAPGREGNVDYGRVRVHVPVNFFSICGEDKPRKLSPDMDPTVRSSESAYAAGQACHYTSSVVQSIGAWSGSATGEYVVLDLKTQSSYYWGWGHAANVSPVLAGGKKNSTNTSPHEEVYACFAPHLQFEYSSSKMYIRGLSGDDAIANRTYVDHHKWGQALADPNNRYALDAANPAAVAPKAKGVDLRALVLGYDGPNAEARDADAREDGCRKSLASRCSLAEGCSRGVEAFRGGGDEYYYDSGPPLEWGGFRAAEGRRYRDVVDQPIENDSNDSLFIGPPKLRYEHDGVPNSQVGRAAPCASSGEVFACVNEKIGAYIPDATLRSFFKLDHECLKIDPKRLAFPLALVGQYDFKLVINHGPYFAPLVKSDMVVVIAVENDGGVAPNNGTDALKTTIDNVLQKLHRSWKDTTKNIYDTVASYCTFQDIQDALGAEQHAQLITYASMYGWDVDIGRYIDEHDLLPHEDKSHSSVLLRLKVLEGVVVNGTTPTFIDNNFSPKVIDVIKGAKTTDKRSIITKILNGMLTEYEKLPNKNSVLAWMEVPGMLLILKATQVDENRVGSNLLSTFNAHGSANKTHSWPFRAVVSGNRVPSCGVHVPLLYQSVDMRVKWVQDLLPTNCINVGAYCSDRNDVKIDINMERMGDADRVAMQIIALRSIVQSSMGMFVAALLFHNPFDFNYYAQGYAIAFPELNVPLGGDNDTNEKIVGEWNRIWTDKGWNEKFELSLTKMIMKKNNSKLPLEEAQRRVYERAFECIRERIKVMMRESSSAKDASAELKEAHNAKCKLAVRLAIHVADHAPSERKPPSGKVGDQRNKNYETTTTKFLKDHKLDGMPTEFFFHSPTGSTLDPLLMYAPTAASYAHQWLDAPTKFLHGLRAYGVSALTKGVKGEEPNITYTGYTSDMNKIDLDEVGLPTVVVTPVRLWTKVDVERFEGRDITETLRNAYKFKNIYGMDMKCKKNDETSSSVLNDYLCPGRDWTIENAESKISGKNGQDIITNMLKLFDRDRIDAFEPTVFEEAHKEWTNWIIGQFKDRMNTLEVVVMGSKFDSKMRGATTIWSCLLYTSPSPRD